MKKKIYSAMFLLLVCFILNGCASKEPAKTPGEEAGTMTFVSNVELSGEAENPPVNDSVQTITLTFSKAIDPSTLEEAVKISRMDSKGDPVAEQCRIALDTNNKNAGQYQYGQCNKLCKRRRV